MLSRLKGVFKSLSDHDVRYVVIGGVAAVLHGVPRATFDLDLLIEASEDNATRLIRALECAGLGTAALATPEGLLANEITVFQDAIRIDVQTSTPGLDFSVAWKNRRTVTHGGAPILLVSREDLIAAKRASGRAVDLEDVQILESDHP